ncbi:MAG TPA: thioredoxin domain-containing protein [Propionibacteriaceae bacterium]|nr:thioredoxin domain-containing protein [Propionibacteriaceae bacterium]
MANRLEQSLSPYLRQHAGNPVDWYEWGDEAFTAAREHDLPIFLSVGYAACHWCHVMAHESFERDDVAAALRDRFVAVKVDREERPDVDSIYMNAAVALTGHGGWPMTCLLTPDGEPFFAGTYLPHDTLLDLLDRAADLWRTRRDDLVAQAAEIGAALSADTAPARNPLGPIHLDAARARLAATYDPRHGGFGGAPKFPPSMVLEFLLRDAARTGSDQARDLALGTLHAMARGGINDQLAGGFARYSVDAAWVVPHFEKMLYDNAQLARVYAHAWRLTGDPLCARVAVETADFMVRDLGTPVGLASSLDADTAGVEGLTYVWRPAELREVLGEADGVRAARLLEVTDAGTFEHGASTLQLQNDPDDPAWWSDVRARLLAARDRRSQPGRDDKVVAGWNGLALAALADVGTLLDRPDLVAEAARIADALLRVHLVDGRMRRVSRDGRAGSAPGQLDDHGDLAEGLLALFQATGDPRWLAAAGELIDLAVRHFRSESGEWFDSPDDGERLFQRPRTTTDNAEPSGIAAVAGALLAHSALTGSTGQRDLAEEALAAMSPVASTDPRFAGWALAVAEAAAAGPLQVAVVGSGPAAADLVRITRRSPSPGLVLASGRPDAAGVPLLAGRPLVGDAPTAYVCREFVCDLPTTSADDLRERLGVPPASR